VITHNDPPSAPATAPPPAPAYANGGAHGRVARLVVVLCFVLTFVATSLIYWRWANVVEPSSYIIIEGDEACNGTVVVVRSDGQPDTTAMATLSKDNDYAAAIFLHPGSYTLTATLNGDRLAHGNLLLAHRRAKVITLRGPKSAAASAPRAGVS
jgi:hypothetical protein